MAQAKAFAQTPVRILDPMGKSFSKVRNTSLLTLGLGFLPNLSERQCRFKRNIIGKTKDEMRNLLGILLISLRLETQ